MTFEASRTEIGPHQSDGARQLWGIKIRKGWSLNHLAEELGTSSGTVTKWLFCLCKPKGEWAARIERKLGIRTIAWTRSPTKSLRDLIAADSAAAE